MKKIFVNIIVGFFGVGKMMVICYLFEMWFDGECWFVFVNEFGFVGLDVVLFFDLEVLDVVEIWEVVGGCICCSVGFLFEVFFVYLFEQELDWLLIELMGFVVFFGILDLFDCFEVCDWVDVCMMICMFDLVMVQSDWQYEEVVDQIEVVDVMVVN